MKVAVAAAAAATRAFLSFVKLVPRPSLFFLPSSAETGAEPLQELQNRVVGVGVAGEASLICFVVPGAKVAATSVVDSFEIALHSVKAGSSLRQVQAGCPHAPRRRSRQASSPTRAYWQECAFVANKRLCGFSCELRRWLNRSHMSESIKGPYVQWNVFQHACRLPSRLRHSEPEWCTQKCFKKARKERDRDRAHTS